MRQERTGVLCLYVCRRSPGLLAFRTLSWVGNVLQTVPGSRSHALMLTTKRVTRSARGLAFMSCRFEGDVSHLCSGQVHLSHGRALLSHITRL